MAGAGIRNITIRFLGNSSSLNAAAGQAQSRLDKFAGAATKVGLAIAGTLAAGAKVAVQAAAEQSASVAAFTQITGKQMDEQNKIIARGLNLSQTEYAKSFTTLSSLYQSNGLSQARANKEAAKGLKIAADQAAFGNTTVAEAVEAQAGLLKGSGELLEKYAISITAADVAARLKAEGLDKLKGAELKAATATVKANIIQEQSAKFAGQAARESNSLESRTQKLTATIEDFKAKMGQKLLPVVEQVVGKLQTMAEWVQNNETKVKIAVAVIGTFAAVLLTVVGVMKVITAVQKAWNIVMIATNVIMFANPITLVVVALVALAAAIVVAYKKSETFRNIVDAAMKAIRNTVITVIQFVVDKFLWYAETILGAASKAFGWVPGLGGKLKKAHAAIAKFRDDTNATLEGLKDHEIKVKLTTTQVAFNKAYKASPQGKAGVNGPFVPIDGARADGGPTGAGRMYLVGERGPELFTSKKSGQVISNKGLAKAVQGGGGQVARTINLDLDLGHGIHEVVQIELDEHDRELKRTYKSGGKRTVATTSRSQGPTRPNGRPLGGGHTS